MDNGHSPAASHGSLISYTVGFVLSIAFTLVAYYLAVHHTFSYNTVLITIAILAVLQFLVQLIFFLHLGRDTKPRWKLLVFALMMITVGILVVGSLWIMHNLDYRMMPSTKDVNDYMNVQNSGF